jgi:hypothetical protein
MRRYSPPSRTRDDLGSLFALDNVQNAARSTLYLSFSQLRDSTLRDRIDNNRSRNGRASEGQVSTSVG